MANYIGVIGCLLVVVAAAMLLQTAKAEDTYVVLDSLGWSVPTNGTDAVYRNWTSGKEFEVGDTLVFNFPTGRHDVAEVSRAAYDACNGTTPLSNQATGPANITLRTSGNHYYICTFPGHCLGGQKLAITVEASSDTPAPSPPTATSPPSGTSSPNGPSSPPNGPSSPPSSGSSSIAFGGIMTALFSAALTALLY